MTFRLFVLLVASCYWAAVSVICDLLFGDFWISFAAGAVAALVITWALCAMQANHRRIEP